MGVARELIPVENRDDLDLYAKFFHGLSNPTRLAIMEQLLEGEKNVSELVDLTGRPQGRVSNHLACLRWCGFVTTRQEGRSVYYQISDARVVELLRLAGRVMSDNAQNILQCTRM